MGAMIKEDTTIMRKTNSENIKQTNPDKAQIINYYNHIKALFEDDNEISISDCFIYEKAANIYIECTNILKMVALQELLANNITIGNTKFDIHIIYSGYNDITEDIIKIALKGNPHFSKYVEDKDSKLCMFKPEMIHKEYYNGFLQDSAKEVFKKSDIIYTMDSKY